MTEITSRKKVISVEYLDDHTYVIEAFPYKCQKLYYHKLKLTRDARLCGADMLIKKKEEKNKNKKD